MYTYPRIAEAVIMLNAVLRMGFTQVHHVNVKNLEFYRDILWYYVDNNKGNDKKPITF